MNTCDSCVHWRLQFFSFGPSPDNPHHGMGCSNPKVKEGKDEDGQIARDYYTCGPKFGCVHHEPKEKHEPSSDS